jgi:hypothetical protein
MAIWVRQAIARTDFVSDISVAGVIAARRGDVTAESSTLFSNLQQNLYILLILLHSSPNVVSKMATASLLRFAKFYNSNFDRRPIPTLIITNGILSSLADTIVSPYSSFLSIYHRPFLIQTAEGYILTFWESGPNLDFRFSRELHVNIHSGIRC